MSSTRGPSRRDRHRQELLVAGRCSHCAESVPRIRILRSEPCPHCERELCQPAGGALLVVQGLGARWRRRRWWYYGVLTAGTLLTGLVPLLAAPVRFLGLVALHVAVVRRPLRWLSVRRRIATRFSTKLLLVVLALVGLLADVAVAGLPVLSGLIASVVTLATALAFAEGARRLIENRAQREAETSRLDWWEWTLPLLLGGVLLLGAGVMLGATAALYYLLFEAPVPTLSDVLSAMGR
jgi:hypothetical protein